MNQVESFSKSKGEQDSTLLHSDKPRSESKGAANILSAVQDCRTQWIPTDGQMTEQQQKLKQVLGVKLKSFIPRKIWCLTLAVILLQSSHHLYQTWPDIITHLPSLGFLYNGKTDMAMDLPNTQHLIPASPFDLMLLAELEQSYYHTLKKCVQESVHSTSFTNYTKGNNLSAIEQYLRDYETSSQILFLKSATLGPELVAGNPIASFRMIDRLVNLQPLAAGHNACREFANATKELGNSIRWPNVEDVEETILRILRIQHIYRLKSEDVSKGILSNISTGIGLSSLQCYKFAQVALKRRYYYLAVDWLEISLIGLDGIQCQRTFYERVLATMRKTVSGHDESWNNSLTLNTQYHFTEKLKTSENATDHEVALNIKRNEAKRDLLYRVARTKYKHIYSSGINYWATCSGEDLRSEKIKSQLFCWLETKNHPTWTIRPLKIELLSLQPDIVQVYDILSDSVIQETLTAATPSMESSTVVDNVIPTIRHLSSLRSSQQAWLKDWNHSKLSHFSKTVERITGMRVASPQASEELQVLSYSFGGHYEPHVDALQKAEFYGAAGDRMMTFMFYMSDVQAGGCTAFTHVGMASRPVKGSGVFWFNLYEDGSSDDPLSQHGACPVILGRKNAANKWVRFHDQFQTRKCSRKQLKVLPRAKMNGMVRRPGTSSWFLPKGLAGPKF